MQSHAVRSSALAIIVAAAAGLVGAARPVLAQKAETASYIVALPAGKDSAVQLVIAALREVNGVPVAPREFPEVTVVGARYEHVQPDNSIRRVTVTVDVSHKPVPNAPGVTVIRLRSWAIHGVAKNETPSAVLLPPSANAGLPVRAPVVPRDTAWVSMKETHDVDRLRTVVEALKRVGGRVLSTTGRSG
jgi:hypothetical protein